MHEEEWPERRAVRLNRQILYCKQALAGGEKNAFIKLTFFFYLY